jgi:hypothetical protein
MTRAENDDWTISIFLPEPQVTVEAPDESVDKHSIRDLMPRFGRVAEVDGRSVEAQWRKTVDTLMRLIPRLASARKTGGSTRSKSASHLVPRANYYSSPKLVPKRV